MSFYPIKVLPLLLCFAAWQAKAQLPAFTYIQTAGGTRPSAGNAVTVDAAGNSYVAGSFGFDESGGSINFGTTNLVSAGGGDGFVAKFNSAGVCQWARQIGGLSQDDAYDVVVDANGMVLVSGEFSGATSIGATNLVSNGGYDIFFAAFSGNGDLLWARAIGGALDDYSIALAANQSGETFFTGSFSGNINLGGGISFSSADEDGLLLKMNPNGAVQWARVAGGTGFQFGSDIKVDAHGSIFWGGEFDTGVSLNGTNLTTPGVNIFLAKYDPAGNLQWARKLGEGEIADLPRIALRQDGGFVCSAVYFGAYTIGNETLPDGSDDVLIASFDPTGEVAWVTTFGGAQLEVCTDLLSDAADDCYLVGHFRGTMPIGNTNLVSSGNADIFVAKCSRLGQLQWARKAGGLSPDVALGGVLAGPAELRFTGSFSGTAQFGNISVTSSDALAKEFLATMTLAPTLKINLQPDHALVSWPASLTNFVLETTSVLGSPSWSPVTTPPAVVNGEFVATNSLANPSQFFRLRSN